MMRAVGRLWNQPVLDGRFVEDEGALFSFFQSLVDAQLIYLFIMVDASRIHILSDHTDLNAVRNACSCLDAAQSMMMQEIQN